MKKYLIPLTTYFEGLCLSKKKLIHVSQNYMSNSSMPLDTYLEKE